MPSRGQSPLHGLAGLNIDVTITCPLLPCPQELKGEPLTRETASKTDENDSLWPHERFFSSLVFATVATALYQLGSSRSEV